MKTNVTKTYLPDKDKFISYIDSIFESWWLTNNGPLAQELQAKLSEYLGVDNLLLVSNWTVALQILYKVFWLSGNIVTTPFSFVATTSSIVWEWLVPKFADIDSSSLTIDIKKASSAIDDNTSAILGVHVYWNPCDVEWLERLAKEKNIKLFFDAAHCFNVDYKDTSILNYGDASTLSFHSTKLFHTIEWGAIIFKNKADYEKARLMINFWISWYEKIDELGINAKMNEFQAAMGLSVLSDIKDNMNKRKVIADYYDANIKKQYLQLKWREEASRNYAYYPIIFDTEIRLQKAINELWKLDIFPRRYFKPSLNKLEYLPYIAMPISESISDRVLCLPMFESLDIHLAHKISEIINYV